MTYEFSPERIADQLRALRIKSGLTLADVSIRIGKSQSAISGYETARRYPDPETLLKLLSFYGVNNVGQFLGVADIDASDISADERKLLAHWRGISDESKRSILHIMENLK